MTSFYSWGEFYRISPSHFFFLSGICHDLSIWMLNCKLSKEPLLKKFFKDLLIHPFSGGLVDVPVGFSVVSADEEVAADDGHKSDLSEDDDDCSSISSRSSVKRLIKD